MSLRIRRPLGSGSGRMSLRIVAPSVAGAVA
jgi:hypothetical protein